MQYRLIGVALAVLLWCSAEAQQGRNQSANDVGLFNNEDECVVKCVGEHDIDCKPINGDGPQRVCRCQSNFYSRSDLCSEECENRQYWSLFTYGSCDRYEPKEISGVCNTQCVFRVRVWTTVFIIILFVAAIIVIIAQLPNLIISCVACVRVRKQRRDMEDMQIANEYGISGTSSKQGAAAAAGPHQQHPAMSPWYPYYNYHYGGRM